MLGARPFMSVVRRDIGGESGFTLLELLIVVMILGVLSAIALPTYFQIKGRAEEAVARHAIRNTIMQYELDRLETDTSSGSAQPGLEGGEQPTIVSADVGSRGPAEVAVDVGPSGSLLALSSRAANRCVDAMHRATASTTWSSRSVPESGPCRLYLRLSASQ
ncbi:MAG: type II secretion system protein [Nitriliruptorales bacterium]|nr:type II secretion system protein [Nitriliruptorales bacterium]